MRIFFAGQGRTRVFDEAYMKYATARNPRRTASNEKKTIYGWTLSDFKAVYILLLVVDLIDMIIIRRLEI
jgi:hypothetical protein